MHSLSKKEVMCLLTVHNIRTGYTMTYPELQEGWQGTKRLKNIRVVTTRSHNCRTKLRIAHSTNQGQQAAEYPHNDRHSHLATNVIEGIRNKQQITLARTFYIQKFFLAPASRQQILRKISLRNHEKMDDQLFCTKRHECFQ